MSLVVLCLTMMAVTNVHALLDPTSMPTEHQELVQAEYEKFMAQRQKEKAAKEAEELRKQQASMPPPPKGISPKELGMKRSDTTQVQLTEQVSLPGGKYFFGTQMGVGEKLLPKDLKDGADVRKLVTVKPFAIDVDCVTNVQFLDFVEATNYKTEAELYQWSFVLDSQASEATRQEVDGENGFGRVKNAQQWMAVMGANWMHPFGPDSTVEDIPYTPVVHVSHKDAVEYCAWAGRRLPTEHEWEYAARGGLVNQSYPWGNKFKSKHMNIWEGDFPRKNEMKDGFHGAAPVKTYPPNAYGLYNMVGNVWEWVQGGKPDARILRGGSFVDSKNGEFNHAVRVSSKQKNSGDSAATNIGFRCAGAAGSNIAVEPTDVTVKKTPEKGAKNSAINDAAKQPITEALLEEEENHIEL